MSVVRTAISLPEELLAEVDRAAEERGESRSRYITRLLRLSVRARRDAEITRRLNALFLDGDVRSDQLRVAAELDDVGTSFD